MPLETAQWEGLPSLWSRRWKGQKRRHAEAPTGLTVTLARTQPFPTLLLPALQQSFSGASRAHWGSKLWGGG